MRLQRHVRRARIDIRTSAGETAHLVAHRVFDFQGGEIEARERAFGRRDIDADRARRFEEIGPARRLRDAVNIGLARVAAARHLPKYPARQAAFEIDAIAEKKIAGELNAAADRVDLLGLEAPQFVGEEQFEPARTSGEEPVHEIGYATFSKQKKRATGSVALFPRSMRYKTTSGCLCRRRRDCRDRYRYRGCRRRNYRAWPSAWLR